MKVKKISERMKEMNRIHNINLRNDQYKMRLLRNQK